MKRNNATTTSWHSASASECLSERQLLRYLEEKVDEQEARIIEQHLDHCPICFGTIGSVRYNQANPFTEDEGAHAEAQCKVSPAEQVQKIMAMYKELNSEPPDHETPPSPEPFWRRVARWLRMLVPAVRIPSPAFAFAATVVVMVGGGLWGVRYYQTGYQVSIAEKLLQKNYRSYIGDVRLAGNFEPTARSTELGPSDKQVGYVGEAQEKLASALDHGADSIAAGRLLAQSLIISDQLDEARSVLQALSPKETMSAAVQNDLGVIQFKLANYEAAAAQFNAAIDLDSQFRQSYYNLAIVKGKLGQPQEAILLLQRFLELETNEGWRRAGESLIDEFMRY